MEGGITMATPSAVMSLLMECALKRDLFKGRNVHAAIFKDKMLRDNTFIGNALINMYAKCGALTNAQQVFDALFAHDIVSWTSLIAAYAHAGHGQRALHNFERSKCEAVSMDSVALSCVAKACGSIRALEKGKELHAEIVDEHLLERDVVLGNALVDMYAKCGALTNAQELFDRLLKRDVVSWTALVVGYCQHGQYEKALVYFNRMQCEGLSPNAMTFSCILKACGSIGAIEQGMHLHRQVLREGLLQNNIVLGTAVMNMYITCGALEKAKEVFDALGVQDMVSWTALIAGYCQYRHDEEAIFCFEQMQSEGLYADMMTLGTILRACGSLGAVEKGIKVHAGILIQGSFGRDNMVGNALVDMYAKCGSIAKAQQIFNELPVQNIASWAALLGGYSQVGKHGVLFKCFNKLIEQGVKPDQVLSSILLNACRCLCLVDEGLTFYETMSARYSVIPTLEHYIGLVGLLGHAGYLDKAMVVIQRMPFANRSSVSSSFLSACRKWDRLKLGELALRHAVHCEEEALVKGHVNAC